ncbi:hypothetical protein C8R43DRAFT_949343 [Mycena crocata]|nr:hypothetical protein C8R43DRAFT_949343 [Mycena crocata]
MNCSVSHCDLNGALVQPLLDRLPCTAKFRVYKPISKVRASCPYILIVTTGEHKHPVPLPLKTPPKIHKELMHLLEEFPSLISPTLADWHVLLANHSHVHAYIKDALKDHYPFGTGWAVHRLLASGRHLQCNIAFKQIVGFEEFEVAGMEKDANTSIVYIRIYMNHMSALAHQRVFEEIEAVIFEDTGKHLQWHPIHAASKDDGLDRMILSWVADQHRGQAKGLVLAFICRKLPQKCPRSTTYTSQNATFKILGCTNIFTAFFLCALFTTIDCTVTGKERYKPFANMEVKRHANWFLNIPEERLDSEQDFWWLFCRMFKKFGSYKSTHISENACTPSLTIYADAQVHKHLMIQDTKIEAWNTKYKTTVAALFKAQDAVHAKAQQLQQEENAQRRQKMEKELGNKEKQLRTTNSTFEKHYETRKEYIHMTWAWARLLYSLYNTVASHIIQ